MCFRGPHAAGFFCLGATRPQAPCDSRLPAVLKPRASYISHLTRRFAARSAWVVPILRTSDFEGLRRFRRIELGAAPFALVPSPVPTVPTAAAYRAPRGARR